MPRKHRRRTQACAEQPELAAIRHADTPPTTPTPEQGATAAEDEAAPPAILYPRDPSLDPQLVWKGKDQQDRHPLEVPAVPIYVQEKIHPQALVAARQLRQTDLFADTGGRGDDPARRTEFYRHDRHWTNRLILGDSLLVLTSLAEKERLKGRVQMVYLDPPYGIKFGSNWQVSTRKRDVKDSRAEDLTRQPEQVKAFRDTWQLGIHSYLSYLRDRLTVARELLTDSGSLFVQIGDENLHLVRCLLDEVFGSANFIAHIAFKKKKMPLGETYLFTTCDYLLWYGKDRNGTKFRKLFLPRDQTEEGDYSYVELADGRCVSRASLGTELPAGARLFQSMDLRSSGRTESCVFPFTFNGKTFFPSEGKSWKTNPEGMRRLEWAGRLFSTANALRYKLYFDDYPVQELSHVWTDTQGATDKEYVVQTSTRVVERCLLMSTDPGDLVLDPTCGSGTTAYVAEHWGRRWITIDTSRVALTLARTRLMAARFPYYLPADSPEGRQKEAEVTGQPVPGPPAHGSGYDLARGFVYRRVPHVTLRSITGNPDIRPGMSREQIDATVRRHADSVVLYDQPCEDRGVVRVTGPFTVESLSPHRVLPAGGEVPGGHVTASPSSFVHIILDNLRRAGVQNTRRKERLVFDRLDPYPGEFLQAEGSYTEGGRTRRAALCVGPEFGTVGPDLLADAAREARRGSGFDLLLVCGFAFDPHAAEKAREIEKEGGRLKVLLVRLNPDLAMGDRLLKKTGAGNLFLVFGEPDLAIERQPDGRLVVAVRGVDVFDPTSGDVRSSGPEDIACWLIDTDYDGACFLVRHAYFLGGQEPYDKLKRALRAEVNEEAWSRLYSARSTPFAPPRTGQIAVKVINHHGDEVLKVYPVGKYSSGTEAARTSLKR
jgi:adenine-specific DNA-methyltransferase